MYMTDTEKSVSATAAEKKVFAWEVPAGYIPIKDPLSLVEPERLNKIVLLRRKCSNVLQALEQLNAPEDSPDFWGHWKYRLFVGNTPAEDRGCFYDSDEFLPAEISRIEAACFGRGRFFAVCEDWSGDNPPTSPADVTASGLKFNMIFTASKGDDAVRQELASELHIAVDNVNIAFFEGWKQVPVYRDAIN